MRSLGFIVSLYGVLDTSSFALHAEARLSIVNHGCVATVHETCGGYQDLSMSCVY